MWQQVWFLEEWFMHWCIFLGNIVSNQYQNLIEIFWLSYVNSFYKSQLLSVARWVAGNKIHECFCTVTMALPILFYIFHYPLGNKAQQLLLQQQFWLFYLCSCCPTSLNINDSHNVYFLLMLCFFFMLQASMTDHIWLIA